MDGVLVDFESGVAKIDEATKEQYKGKLDEIPGIFALMDPIPGAAEVVRLLARSYDVFILTTSPWNNPTAASDKVQWVKKYMDDVFHKRLIITHRKDLLDGDYLIDDRDKNGITKVQQYFYQVTFYQKWRVTVKMPPSYAMVNCLPVTAF